MAKQPYSPPPKPRVPDSSTFKGTQVGEREYNSNSVTKYKADQFLKKSNQKIPQFNNTREMMDWLQKFVSHEKPEPGPQRNPFSTLKDNPLMPQLKAGINPYPGTRGYKSKTEKKPTLEDFIKRHPRK